MQCQNDLCDNARMSTVSVVIPAYNHELYIREALESVVRQTRPADQIIVVDDGSTDRTGEVAESFPGVTVVHQHNRGLSAARNRGIAEATSEWVALLDSDDVWRADKLELQMAALDATPGYDACTSNAVALRGAGEPADFEPAPSRLPPSDEIAGRLRGSLRLPPGTLVIRRDLFGRVGGFDETLKSAEDWDMWLRLAAGGCRFLLVPQDLLFIRVHGANMSNHAYRMMEAELRVWDANIGPTFPAALRPLRRLQAKSHFLGRVALVEREQNRPHLGVMARSLLLSPVGDWPRYKVFAHMVLRRMGLIPAK